MTNPYTPAPQPTRPSRAPRAWSWGAVGFGALVFISMANVHGPLSLIGNTLFGLGFMLPGAWWLWNDRQYSKALESYQRQAASNEYLTNLLQDTDPEIVAGMGSLQPPARPEMRWPIITILTVVLLLVGANLI